MTTLIYCFRDDLRLHDNPALTAACQQADYLLPVHVSPQPQTTRWGFERVSARRRAFRHSALQGLATALQQQGSGLLHASGSLASVLPALASQIGATAIYCEDIATPEEQDELAALRACGLAVHSFWQSTLLAPDILPWADAQLPDQFTRFRQQVEAAAIQPEAPLPEPALPPLPPAARQLIQPLAAMDYPAADPRSSFPFPDAAFAGSETAALAHLAHYLQRGLPHSYKATRNGLHGIDYSSKFSPWLACGSLSPRLVLQQLHAFEAEHGHSDSSYWLWFELLWRDYFKLLQRQHGRRLYHPGGLPQRASPPHNPAAFQRWMAGQTGHALIDAGMRELAATGYLGNRMRQIAASYLIHELQCDWRAGAAWFEACLLDYDCSQSQGNWLYLAGLGTVPRGGRRFNPDKQAAEYDADGHYRQLWSQP